MIGLYKGEIFLQIRSLVALIKDALLRMNLSLNKAREQCYDGTANMSEAKSGVGSSSLMRSPEYYTHIAMDTHTLNLAYDDTIKRCKLLQDTLDTTYLRCSYEITKNINKIVSSQKCNICTCKGLTGSRYM